MMQKLFLLLTLSLMALALMSGCLEPTEPSTGETVNVYIAVAKDNEMLLEETIEVEKGTTGLEATQLAATVVYQEYAGMGVFVTSIEGIESNDQYYWALHVDGSYAEKAIDAYILDADTNITWIYTEIDLGQLG